MMIHKVWDYMKLNNMMEKGDRIVVGVSGGADSVCLLLVLQQLCSEYEANLVVVHINHGMRGKDADSDEQFVAKLCEERNIVYHSFYYDVKKIAKEECLTEEEAGRKVRYQAFIQICKEEQCNKVAIAHNKNDNAETVLFHLFRGSGIKGLSGIDPIRKLRFDQGEVEVIRPLLCVEREEIEEFLHQNVVPYRIDATNLTDDYSRNKIRNRVLTYATQEINQGAVQHIFDAAIQLREIEEYLRQNTEHAYSKHVTLSNGEYTISVNRLRLENIVIQKSIIRSILENLAGKLKDMEAKHVDQVLELCHKSVGKQINLPYGVIAKREYEDIKFYLTPKSDPMGGTVIHKLEPLRVPIPGKLFIQQMNKYLVTEIKILDKYEPIPKNSCVKWFNYAKIENAVEIRSRREGDYLQINQLGGKKKLKDYFIDHKVPRQERDNRILIADGNHIMWILGDGERMSEKYKVEESTQKVLLMKFIDAEENEHDKQRESNDIRRTGK
jgi:tRNA(Ile)-lysidine synthase